jgi:DNA sulfur modification protein DndC
MIRELLHIEKEFRLMSRRAGLFEKLERAISRGFYESAEDAREKVKIDFFEKENLAKAVNSNF